MATDPPPPDETIFIPLSMDAMQALAEQERQQQMQQQASQPQAQQQKKAGS